MNYRWLADGYGEDIVNVPKNKVSVLDKAVFAAEAAALLLHFLQLVLLIKLAVVSREGSRCQVCADSQFEGFV